MGTLLGILIMLTAAVGAPFRTMVVPDANIATLQVTQNGDQLSRPVVALGEGVIDIDFDELSYVPKNFYYKVMHCDAHWMPSDLMTMEYIDGMDDIMIDDYEFSQNTVREYIHYHVAFPNDNVRLTKSGNYAVVIARDNDFDNGVVAVACFSVVEPLTSVTGEVSATTLKGVNGEYQQLSLELNADMVHPRNAMTDFTLLVRQNGRYDNEVYVSTPAMMTGSRVKYVNLPALTFEGGNQYRSVDFSSRYTYGSGIDRFVYDDTIYHVLLEPDYFDFRRRTYAEDARGGFVVNHQGSGEYSRIEADYVYVDFSVPCEAPFLDGKVYLLAGGTYNMLDGTTLMDYDFEHNEYYKTVLMKQGGYNYQYVFQPKSGDVTMMKRTEGSFWQTANRYEIMVYYRPAGERYDRLVGYFEL